MATRNFLPPNHFLPLINRFQSLYSEVGYFSESVNEGNGLDTWLDWCKINLFVNIKKVTHFKSFAQCQGCIWKILTKVFKIGLPNWNRYVVLRIAKLSFKVEPNWWDILYVYMYLPEFFLDVFESVLSYTHEGTFVATKE